MRILFLDPIQESSLTIEEGEGGGINTQSKPLRRAIMLPSPRRSQRLNPTDFYGQSESVSQPNSDQPHASLLALQLNNLLEGKLVKKEDLLTHEDDTDFNDNCIDSNL